MTPSALDLQGLLRALVLGLGVGLIVTAIGRLVGGGQTPGRRSFVFLAALGAALVTILIIYYAWPSLAIIPPLDNLSRAEAEDGLTRRGLTPDVMSQYSGAVEAGRVVPGSQNPPPGQKVRRGRSSPLPLPLGRQPRLRRALQAWRHCPTYHCLSHR